MVVVFFWPDDDGPRYKGISLKEWALIHDRATGRESVHNSKYDPDKLRESEAAILAIGTNALPSLLDWIQIELKPTPWRDKIADIIDKVPGELWDQPPLNAWLGDRNWDRFQAAGVAFDILGTNASPALAELTRLLFEQRTEDLCGQAAHGLACIGEAGVPPLLVAAEDPSFRYRRVVVANLWSEPRWGTNSSRVIELLAKSVSDSEERVALRAAESLGSLEIEPEISIPALTNGLSDQRKEVRFASVRSLGWMSSRMGKRVVPALPALVEALTDTSREVRDCATNVILKIAPETLSRGSNSVGKAKE